MSVATMPNNPSRAAARKLARKAMATRTGRKALARGATTVLGSPIGHRAVRWAVKRYTRRVLDGVRWQPLVYIPAVVTFARLRRKLGPPPAAVTLAAVYVTPLAVGRALPRGRVRDYLTWLSHMWAYKVAFEVPYDRPDRARQRLRIDQPIAVDRAIGFGTPPNQRLQQRLRRPPELTLLDKTLTGIYMLWEAEPHLALAWLLSRHPGRFPGAALRMALTFDSTLIGYSSHLRLPHGGPARSKDGWTAKSGA